MAYEYDADANRSSWWNQHDEPDREEEDPDEQEERITCPKHGPTIIVEYIAALNAFKCQCRCLV